MQIKENIKLRVTGLCEGNSPVTGEFPTQRASNAKMFPFDDVTLLFKRILKLFRCRDWNSPDECRQYHGCSCPGLCFTRSSEVGFQPSVLSQCPEMIHNVNLFSMFSQNDSVQEGLICCKSTLMVHILYLECVELLWHICNHIFF